MKLGKLLNSTVWERESGSAFVVRTRGLKDPWVTVAVASCKRLHHPVNLLSFSRETKAPEELSARRQRSQTTCKHNIKHPLWRRRRNPSSSENKKKGKTAATFFADINSARRTSAPAPDSGRRIHAGPQTLSVSADAFPLCGKFKYS